MCDQKHKRFYDIRNVYINEVDLLAQRRYEDQQRQKGMSVILSVSLSLYHCMYFCFLSFTLS